MRRTYFKIFHDTVRIQRIIEYGPASIIMHLQKLREKKKDEWFEIGNTVCQQGWSYTKLPNLYRLKDFHTVMSRLRGFPANLHKTTCVSTHPHAIRKSPWIKHQNDVAKGTARRCIRSKLPENAAVSMAATRASWESFVPFVPWFWGFWPPQKTYKRTQSFLQTRELEPVDARCTCGNVKNRVVTRDLVKSLPSRILLTCLIGKCWANLLHHSQRKVRLCINTTYTAVFIFNLNHWWTNSCTSLIY